MKKLLTNLTFLFTIGTLLVYFAGCNGDNNDPDPELTNDLLGLWTVSNIEFDAKVGTQSIIDYLVNEGGMTQAEAELLWAFYEALLLDELDATGTIEFKANNTYLTNFGGSPDDGTWKLSADGKTLTLDEGTIDDMDLTVSSLTSSMLIVIQTEITEEDIDDDPLTPDVEIVIEITMTLTK